MDKRAIIEALRGAGVICIDGWYEQGNEPEKPYAVLNYLGTEPLFADNHVYLESPRWQVDLITKRSDQALEQAVVGALAHLSAVPSSYSTPHPEDGYVQTTFIFTAMEGAEDAQ